MDDLSVVPMMLLESIAVLNKMGYKDFSLLEEKIVSMDVKKINFFLFLLQCEYIILVTVLINLHYILNLICKNEHSSI